MSPPEPEHPVPTLRRRSTILFLTLVRRRGTLALWGGLLGFVLLWRVTPLRHAVDEATLRRTLDTFHSSPTGLAAIFLGFVLLASLGFPSTVLIAAIGAVIEPEIAIPLCITAVMASALVGHRLGRALSARNRDRLLGHRMQRLQRVVVDGGVLGIALLRNVPLAPFAVMNVGCGSMGVPPRSYFLGTFLGTLPGILLVTWFGSRIGEWTSDPTFRGLLVPGVLAVLFLAMALGAGVFFRRWRNRVRLREEQEPSL